MRFILLACIAALLCMAAPATAATITVPDDYPSLQVAISAASAGDTVLIRSGIYTVSKIEINTPDLTIMGEEHGSVIIERGDRADFMIRPTAHRTRVENITFKNMILSVDSSYNIIARNEFFTSGLKLNSDATFNCICDNYMTEGTTSDSRFIINNGHSHLISGNTVKDSSYWGIYIRARNCTVIQNAFINNAQGISLRSATPPGEPNRVYLNTVTGNGVPVAIANTASESDASWVSPDPIDYTYNGAPYSGVMGNHWGSDYTGADANGDGIGDTPFTVLAGLGDDTAPLMAPFGDYFGSTPVLTTIEVSPETATMAAGATQQFAATAKDQAGNKIYDVALTWSSSNETVGTVNGTGFLTALAAGTATVAASAESVTGTAQVTVFTPAVTSIEVSPATANLLIGATQQFTATAKDQAGNEISGVVFDWSSSNETVGTVNATGFFTALEAGTATVTAAAEDAAGTAQVTASVPLSDLTFTGMHPMPPGWVFAREPNQVRIELKNNGPGAASEIAIALYASDVSNGTVAINSTTIASLASGEITLLMLTDPTIRNLQGGTVTYTAIVDPDNLIAESDEDNNVRVSPTASVVYNGYKGKMYWEGGSNVTTVRTYDIRGDIIHSFGDSQYMSGSFGSEGWTNYTVTWTAGDLPLPEGAAVHDAWLYVPYCWDNTNSAPDNISIDFNGARVPYVNWYNDVSNFGAYADHYYGLLTYNVTDLYQTGANNTALFARATLPVSMIAPENGTYAVASAMLVP
ncbi:MAG: DUF3344 domain-containing protein [Methanomicrobiales archaeon]|nr:DUF3344 domain-containing protein [Methanomicrobiales archaeon]